MPRWSALPHFPTLWALLALGTLFRNDLQGLVPTSELISPGLDPRSIVKTTLKANFNAPIHYKRFSERIILWRSFSLQNIRMIGRPMATAGCQRSRLSRTVPQGVSRSAGYGTAAWARSFVHSLSWPTRGRPPAIGMARGQVGCAGGADSGGQATRPIGD